MSDVDSPKVLWESIKARYGGADRVKEARLQTLNSEFDRLKMHETETIDVFAGKLAGIASPSASLGETIDESKLVKKLLKVVPRKFIHLVASLEQVLDLKTVGFEDVVGRLKAYEERIRCDDGGDEQQRLLFTRSNGGSGSSSGSGGRCDGGGSSRDGRNTGGGGVSSGVSGVSWSIVMLTRSSGGGAGSSNGAGGGGRSSSGGWNSGGGFDVSGFPGFSLSREMKGKMGTNNRSKVINNRGDGFINNEGSGSKAQNINKPNKPKQPNCISEKQETIGSNQVQENAELDWNQRHL